MYKIFHSRKGSVSIVFVNCADNVTFCRHAPFTLFNKMSQKMTKIILEEAIGDFFLGGPLELRGRMRTNMPKKGLKFFFDQNIFRIFLENVQKCNNFFLGRSSTPQDKWKNFWDTPLEIFLILGFSD